MWLKAQCCTFNGPLQLGVTGAAAETGYQIGRDSGANAAANNEPCSLQYFG